MQNINRFQAINKHGSHMVQVIDLFQEMTMLFTEEHVFIAEAIE